MSVSASVHAKAARSRAEKHARIAPYGYQIEFGRDPPSWRAKFKWY
ncbi:hypothetical protein ACFS07_29515 [Undibacterium arcticum]